MNKHIALVLCLALYLLCTLLRTYNWGRVETGCDNLNDIAVPGIVYYYGYDFSLSNVDVPLLLMLQLFLSVTLVPWVIWLVRKRNFRMGWLHWIYFVATVCAYSYMLFKEIWKLTHTGWYDTHYGLVAPEWWNVFESIGCCGMLVCIMIGTICLFYEVVRAVMYPVLFGKEKEVNR